MKMIFEVNSLFFIPEYKGYQVNSSSHENNGLVNQGTSNAIIANNLEFDRTGKYFYEKWVPRSEVKIIKKRANVQL